MKVSNSTRTRSSACLPLELVNRQYYMTLRQFASQMVLALCLAGFIVLMYALLFDVDVDTILMKARDALPKTVERIKESPWGSIDLLIIMPAVIVATVYAKLFARQRMILDADGICFRSNLPDWLNWLSSDWQARWSDIQSAGILPAHSLQANLPRQILITTSTFEKKLLPAFWTTREEIESGGLFDHIKFRRDAQQGIDDLYKSHVVRYMQESGVELSAADVGDQQASTFTFKLEENPRTIKVLVVLAMLAAYITVDGLLLEESYPSVPLVYEIIWSAMCLAVIVAGIGWLRSANVPWGVGIGLGFVLFFLLYPALYIGSLRVNMLTDKHGLSYYRYSIESGVTLVPELPDLPVITYFDNDPFWNIYMAGKPVEIELRKGGLGIWQFNLGKIREQMGEYHEQHRQ